MLNSRGKRKQRSGRLLSDLTTEAKIHVRSSERKHSVQLQMETYNRESRKHKDLPLSRSCISSTSCYISHDKLELGTRQHGSAIFHSHHPTKAMISRRPFRSQPRESFKNPDTSSQSLTIHP